MRPCADTCALAATLQTLLWLGVYLWTVLGLRPLVLGDGPGGAAVADPTLKVGHRLFSWAALVGGGLAGIASGEALAEPPLSFGLGALTAALVCNTANGLYELATGICPIYGVIVRRQQVFLRHGRVRALGLARLLMSALLLVVAALQIRWA